MAILQICLLSVLLAVTSGQMDATSGNTAQRFPSIPSLETRFSSGDPALQPAGTLAGTTRFSGGTQPAGSLAGTTLFSSGSQPGGTLSGTTRFSTGTQPAGSLDGTTRFSSGTQPAGSLAGTTRFSTGTQGGTLGGTTRFPAGTSPVDPAIQMTGTTRFQAGTSISAQAPPMPGSSFGGTGVQITGVPSTDSRINTTPGDPPIVMPGTQATDPRFLEANYIARNVPRLGQQISALAYGIDDFFPKLRAAMDWASPRLPAVQAVEPNRLPVLEPYPERVDQLRPGESPLYFPNPTTLNGTSVPVYVPFRRIGVRFPLYFPFDRQSWTLRYPEYPMYYQYEKQVNGERYPVWISYQQNASRFPGIKPPLALPFQQNPTSSPTYIHYVLQTDIPM